MVRQTITDFHLRKLETNMQTFLPELDFFTCALILDNKRLGKQRLEAMQILNAMYNPKNHWYNHVAVRMWRGWEDCLKYYANWVIREWKKRGFENNMKFYQIPDLLQVPDWLMDERLHKSHKCNLMRKHPDYYRQFGWTDIDVEAPYWWPVALKDPKNQAKMVSYWGE